MIVKKKSSNSKNIKKKLQKPSYRKMRFFVNAKRCCRVQDLYEKRFFDLEFVSDSQDIRAVKEYLGNPEWFDYGCLFVSVVDGDYGEIYGCESNIPYLDYWVDKIEWGFK